MNCRLIIQTLLLVVLSIGALHADSYYTHPLINSVKTLQVIADGDCMKLPVIDTSGQTSLEISFDFLSDEEQFLQYRIVHCDAGWEADGLSELEYLDGFMPLRVNEVEASFNTYLPYYHYVVRFPNPDAGLLVSGNYAVIFHPENEDDEPIAVACFSVSEQMAFAGGAVSANTDIDYLQQHQQLTLQCTWSPSRLPYLNPMSDLLLMVTQNHRRETCRKVLAPSRIEAGKAYYEHQKVLIFEACNQYRRFEFTDYRYATLGVEQVRLQDNGYHVRLVTDRARSNGVYRFDKDQHAHYKVHALRVGDEATESEYFWAEFLLSGAMLPADGVPIYLDGDFTYGQQLDSWQMRYDSDRQCYVAETLLKQGHYNYQYLASGSTAVVEGNYYETHNQYDIYVYYRPAGGRYDRLLGVAQLEN